MRTGIRGTLTVENGQEISLQEIQKLEVQVLSKFIDYCKAHDLNIILLMVRLLVPLDIRDLYLGMMILM